MHNAPRGSLVSLSLSMLLASLGTSIANVGLPSLARAFDASFHAVQWVVLAYLLAITAVIVSAGRLGDRLGRRRLLLAGLLLFAVACGLCGMAPALEWLIVARVLQGLGAAVMMAMALGMVGDTVTKQRTGRVMGLLGTMSAVGTAMGPSVGGVLLSVWGWRSIFLVGVPLGLVAVALAYRYLPVDRQHEPSSTGSNFWSSLQDASLRAGLAMSALVAAVIMATFVVGPFYLSRGLGLAPEWMGLAMAVGPCIAAVTGVPAGRLTDRLGSRRMTLAGLGVLACGALLLSFTSGLFMYLGALVILTTGYSLFQAANNTAVMKDVQPANRGTVSGLLNLSRNLGLIVGASVLGAVFAWATPEVTHATAQSVANGLHVTFGVALGVILLAGAIRHRH
ncbi:MULTISPECIES: MFS transporter [unclassified Pseudomonas]|uniref:MFS transporter n=1 Tax=unclassified Pseudomonas TaxID=196821 RepID=UPI0008127EAF|nr:MULTISPECIES: MFS transporter [unclassified Pseudomonas]CRM45050.1 Spectinomycin tetracycline efflux pump [Pseudomonas sp. 24 E 1]CRM66168.1 Spectinomycin tetracycline efflux pump [Pseudomonas sp. 24 R 17]